MNPRTGRPPSDDPRSKNLNMWVTSAEHEIVKAADAVSDEPLSAWMRTAVLEEAQKRIAAAKPAKRAPAKRAAKRQEGK